MMSSGFKFTQKFTNLLFYSWDSSDNGELIATCSVFVVMTLLLELLKEVQQYFKFESEKSPLTYAKTEENISRTSPLVRSLLMPDQKHIKRRRLKYHVARSFVHIIQLLTGYLIMLAIMSYNAWILIAVVAGSGIGYYTFAIIRFKYAEPKYREAESQSRESLLAPENIDYSGAYRNEGSSINPLSSSTG